MRRAALLTLFLAACTAPARRPGLPAAASAALTALEDHARARRPDALVVARGGTVLLDRRTRAGAAPIHTRSLTKLFTAAALGLLEEDGRLRLSDRVQGPATLRHLLGHAADLEPKGRFGEAEYVLAAAAAERAARRPLDEYLAERLFVPLGLPAGSWSWQKDKAGARSGDDGLSLTADGLLAFGRLWLDGGWRGDARLLPERFVADALSPQNPADGTFGLGWLLLGRDVRGRPPWDGFWMNGHDGQVLFVHPASGVVCVQLVKDPLPAEEQRRAVAAVLEPCRRLARALTPP